MDIRTREAVRYLGYGKHAVDERTKLLISDSFRELEQAANAKSIYRIFDFNIAGTNQLTIGKLQITSRHLSKNMRGCREAVAFAATLGTGVDMLLKKYSVTDMAKVVVLQACATAMLEEYCDLCQKQIQDALEPEGLYLRPRFSPGYGDFSIAHQDMLLRMLEAAKTIGLTLTNGGMLTPMKSVTAVIGVSNEKVPCHIKGCEICQKSDCLYRRNES